jgi:hypothetical protein
VQNGRLNRKETCFEVALDARDGKKVSNQKKLLNDDPTAKGDAASHHTLRYARLEHYPYVYFVLAYFLHTNTRNTQEGAWGHNSVCVGKRLRMVIRSRSARQDLYMVSTFPVRRDTWSWSNRRTPPYPLLLGRYLMTAFIYLRDD